MLHIKCFVNLFKTRETKHTWTVSSQSSWRKYCFSDLFNPALVHSSYVDIVQIMCNQNMFSRSAQFPLYKECLPICSSFFTKDVHRQYLTQYSSRKMLHKFSQFPSHKKLSLLIFSLIFIQKLFLGYRSHLPLHKNTLPICSVFPLQ